MLSVCREIVASTGDGLRLDRIIPLAVKSMALNVERRHFLVADFDASRVAVAVDVAAHGQPSAGFG